MIFGSVVRGLVKKAREINGPEVRRITLQACVCVATLLLFVSCGHTEQLDLSRLKLSEGFHIAVFATAPHARMLAFSPGSVLLVTDMSDGKVLAFPDPKHTGKAERTVTVLDDLNAPHGIAFHNGKLYVTEINAVRRYDWDEAQLKATNGQKIADLPGSGGGHSTRTIIFWNGKMCVAAGSSCNVCKEDDPRRAAVTEYNEDGSGQRLFASGLRNSVGLAINPKTDTIWAVDNGRDWLGDNLPPEEVNDLGTNGGNFGWPYCYGDRVPNPEYGDAARCARTIPPAAKLQAHSAPLGLTFLTRATQLPEEYRGDLLVAYHGSWNRDTPTGAKVVRVHVAGGSPGAVEDLITGWQQADGGRWGRPVDVIVAADGSVLISDDAAGAIYRLSR